jgi:hypothetical protein
MGMGGKHKDFEGYRGGAAATLGSTAEKIPCE